MKKDIAVGVDIGGTNTVFGAVDESGNCLAKSAIKTTDFPDVAQFIDCLSTEIKSLLESKGLTERLCGIGIGAPNGNFYKGTIEYAPNLAWKGVINFADLMKNHFDVPVLLTNDANAAALGEKIYGGAKEMNDFILITLGTGLGSGFYSNGNLVYGHDGFAGELGHTIVLQEGRKCNCGRKGCLETYVSATGITKTVNELIAHTKIPSTLRDCPTEELNSKKIYEAAQINDSLAIKAFDYTCRVLALKLSDAVAITSPEAIFLFGGLAQAKEFIFEPVKEYLEEYLLPIFRNKVKILPSQLPENNAAILGASALIRNIKG